MNKIAVIGLGYVGLPLALEIDKSGLYSVTGFDISEDNITNLKGGICDFDNAFSSNVSSSNISFTNQEDHLEDIDTYLICVPTPVKNKYEPDLDPIISATRLVAKYLQKGNFVVIESTVNPGVSEEIVLPVLESETSLKGGEDFELSHCPERINPGDTKWNVNNIPRNIGSLTKDGNSKLAQFYRSFLDAEINEVSSLKVAEATKIIENTFRDINIAYVNELAKSFDALEIDLVETIQAASNKPFAFMPHYPGCGVGGHCIPVDPYYLIARANKTGFDHKFLKMAREVNKSMPEYTIDLIIKALNEVSLPIKGSKILMYGLSYKANVGDLRESPALVINETLKKWQPDLLAFDPYISDEETQLDDLYEFPELLLICTDHSEIKELDISKFTNLKVIVDGRNCLNIEKIPADINYYGIGRKKINKSN